MPQDNTPNTNLNSTSDIFRHYRENFFPIFAYATAMQANISTEMLNEVRNCFDHLARADEGRNPEGNIVKAKNHLDRACLDCIKISWVALKNRVEILFNSFTVKEFMLIESGNFWKEISIMHNDFRKKSYEARLGESEHMHEGLSTALELYSIAIKSGEALKEKIESKLNDLSHIKTLTDQGEFKHKLRWAIIGAFISLILSIAFIIADHKVDFPWETAKIKNLQEPSNEVEDK